MVRLERAFRCLCLVRCRFEVLVAISRVPWLLVDALLLAIPLALINVFFSFKPEV